ncbi:hypothetical protein [Paraflavitalea speifideaquila]|uniref:hypothetical protein n=1 Tax=Paraflavitalea speifideaquila TaxID=3076558 RepID=UPI0028E43120|nr:hypothetical protein [Paraflavitalea speifideiaquila]
MTYNFLQGYGFSVNSSAIEDLGTVIHVPDNGWPPGYNLLFLFFNQLTGKNYVQASFLIDCLATLLFFWYCRKTLLLIRFPAWLTNLFLLFQGFLLTATWNILRLPTSCRSHF